MMFNIHTLQALTVKCVLENDIPFQTLPNLLHQDINTLFQVKQCREKEQKLSQKLEILANEIDQSEYSAISHECAAYASEITIEKQDELIEESEFFFNLVYKMHILVEEYEKKLGDIEEEEGFLIATLPHQYYKMNIKLKELPNYDETKQKVMELLDQ
jgi:hypothetical protein